MRKASRNPVRSCLGCMKTDVQSAMVRIAANGGQVVVDFDRRLSGRGGYLHPNSECLHSFVNAKLRNFRALKTAIDRDNRRRIALAIGSRLDSRASSE